MSYSRGDQIRKKLLMDLVELDPSLGYDEIKQMIFNDPTRIDNAMAYIVIATRLLLGKINFNEAIQLLPIILDSFNPLSLNYNPNGKKLYEIGICNAINSMISVY